MSFGENEIEKPIHNSSSAKLTREELDVLRHESKFNISDAKPLKFIAEFESALAQSSDNEEERDVIRHKVSSVLSSHELITVLSKRKIYVLNKLKTKYDITILPADERGSTVILNTSECKQKLADLLLDTELYE